MRKAEGNNMSLSAHILNAKSWTEVRGQILYTPTPENSWRVAFQGRFFAFRTTFSHISWLFLSGFLGLKKYGLFKKASGSAEPRASENQNVPATLVFQWCPKTLILPIFKAYERKWPKTLSGKNARNFFNELKRLKT